MKMPPVLYENELVNQQNPNLGVELKTGSAAARDA
jgi:hypothetical protein